MPRDLCTSGMSEKTSMSGRGCGSESILGAGEGYGSCLPAFSPTPLPFCAKKRPRFWAQVVVTGVSPADMDYRRAYTLQCINKQVGLDRRPQH